MVCDAGTANGIVWAHENSSPAVLHAYNARDLTQELYTAASEAGTRDQFGPGNKFIIPPLSQMARCKWEQPIVWRCSGCCPDSNSPIFR
jgi:hypothetical protein